tara:strand:- start:46 stop:585 length:540 start_codon:yes stop_codon:yes gene_type:complete
MIVREKHLVVVDIHPYYQALNERLLEDVSRFNFYTPAENTHSTNIMGSQYNLKKGEETSAVKLVLDWVYSRLRSDYRGYSLGAEEHQAQFNCMSWFARYNEGEYTLSHRHKSVLFGFVYFIKAPKGAAPFVFTTSGNRIKAEEGKVIIFPGNLYHHVPKNKCKDRLVLAGNIIFQLNKD